MFNYLIIEWSSVSCGATLRDAEHKHKHLRLIQPDGATVNTPDFGGEVHARTVNGNKFTQSTLVNIVDYVLSEHK